MLITILGGGVSGLTAAVALRRLGADDCIVFEEHSEPGGLCRAICREGFRFDLVSHVLHFRNSESEEFVRSFLSVDLQRIERRAWIHYRGCYVPYPFQTHLGFLPLRDQISCLAGYASAFLRGRIQSSKEPGNFAEWIRRYFGDGIAEKFMIPYNTKVWGIPPTSISTDWVRPFVPRGSFREILAGLFDNRSNGFGYNSCFYFPREGATDTLVSALAARTPSLQLERRATEVDLEQQTVRFQDGSQVRYDRLISTIPLKTLVRLARGVPAEFRALAEGLHTTTMQNITLCLREPLPHDFHWVYFPEAQFPFFRLVFPSNISQTLAPPGCSIISAEISNPPPARPEDVEKDVIDLLGNLNFIRSRSAIAFAVHTFLPHAYPVHDLTREERVTRLREYLKSRSVWSIGRFGGWHYSSIDDAISSASAAAREIVQKVSNDSGSFLSPSHKHR